MSAAPATESGGITRDEMIESTACQLEALAFRVTTRDGIGGRQQPVPTNGFVPDVRGRWVDTVVLVRAETPETLHTQDSEDHWEAFGRSYLRFEVACPAAIVGEARELARRRGVRVHRYWVY